MAVSDEFLEFVTDQLASWAPVRIRRMFGGAGLYSENVMFALVADDVLYLKVDDTNRQDFIKAGSEPFNPFPEKGRKAKAMPYYEAPADVLESPTHLAQWAQRSLEIARKKTDTAHPIS